MKRTCCTLSVAALAILLVMMAGRSKIYGASPTEEKQPIEVRIDNFAFSPNPVTVPAGTTVRWTNHDDIPHTVVLNSLGVRSKTMDTDGSFTYKFDKAGTFFYVCGLHPYMQAKVVVK